MNEKWRIIIFGGSFFFVIALILAILGVRGAGISMEIAKWLIIVFIILAVLSLILGGSFNMLALPLRAT